MSHLDYKAYDGVGKNHADHYGYSQSVKVGDTVYVSGQGGWRQQLPKQYPSTQEDQIDQAFLNLSTALKDAGATFDNVFKVVSYHIALQPDPIGRVAENMAKYMPNHKPLWTCVEVTRLGEPEMLVEIEVVAHVPKA